ncbi:MAG: DUF2484 family protein [Albidovulum sp.]
MSWPLLAAAIWALAATFTAFLPMRLQYPPGITLLILAPAILIWIGLAHGVFWALLGSVGFVSMFRKPLIFFARKALFRPSSSDPKP